MKLSTRRLDLVAATLEHICAELESIGRLESMLGARIDSDWPPGEYDRQAQEFFRSKLKEGGAAVVGWYIWYVILRDSAEPGSVLIGTAGFLGPPNDLEEVEVGYSILPSWEGQGFATELVEALTHHAFTAGRVRKVIAQAASTNRGSQRVLEKTGFACIGQGDEAGLLRFEISRITRK